MVEPKNQVTVNGLLFFKVRLGSPAHRAFPIIRYVFPFGTGGHAIVGITLLGIIDIPTDRTYIPVHAYPPFVYELVSDKTVISISVIFFAQADVQFFLYCSTIRFKSIFMLLYFSQASLAQRLKQFFAGAAHGTFPVLG
jgi:hypothetical protein